MWRERRKRTDFMTKKNTRKSATKPKRKSRSLALGTCSAGRHECTQGREGQTGSWCVKCGLKIYEVDPRECQHCAHFKDVGFPGQPRAICTKHLMGVTRDMHVTYEITKGSCFSPNNKLTDAPNKGLSPER